MYSKLLKEESNRILFQYFDDYKRSLLAKGQSLDMYFEEIELTLEAHESFEFNFTQIMDSYEIPFDERVGDTNDSYKKYETDFLKEVRKAFNCKIKELLFEIKSELKFEILTKQASNDDDELSRQLLARTEESIREHRLHIGMIKKAVLK